MATNYSTSKYVDLCKDIKLELLEASFLLASPHGAGRFYASYRKITVDSLT